MRIIPKMVMNEERVIKINFLVKGCECGSWLSSFFALSLRTADLQKCYWISGQFSRVLVLVYFYGYDLLRRPKKWDALLNKRRTQWCTTLLFKKVLSARTTVFKNHQKIAVLLNYTISDSIDWNARDFIGSTAFMPTCNNGHKDIVEFL